MRVALAVTLLATLAPAASAEKLAVEDAVKLALTSNPRFRAVKERAGAAHDQARAARGRLGFAVRLGEEYQHWDCPAAISFAAFSQGAMCLADANALPVPPGLAALGPLGAAFAAPVVARSQDTNSFSATVDQPLLGLLHHGYDYAAQKEGAQAADAGVAVGEAAVREQVRAGFLRYFEARALEQIAAASVGELDEQAKVARARLQAGVITNADLLRVVVAQANARQQQILAGTSADVARANLLDTIGLPADDRTIELDEPRALLVEGAAGLPDVSSATREAEHRRPELLQGERTAQSAKRARSARWLSLLPEVDAEGGYLRIDGQLFAPQNQWFVGVRAGWTLWEWGASFYQARAADRLAHAAALDLDQSRLTVATEVHNGLSQTRAAGAAVEVAQTAIASAEEAYRVTNALVQAGSATTTDLLDAQAALTTARLNLTRAQYERAIQRVSLARVLAE
jgi:outer membrane protein TolC